jgi:hypothetical protein
LREKVLRAGRAARESTLHFSQRTRRRINYEVLMNRHGILVSSVLSALLMATTPAAGQTPTFGVPNAPLPAGPGSGLTGLLWSSAEIEPVDDLAAAHSYIAAHAPDATFLASSVDYPNGPSGSTLTDTSLAAGMGVDAASLSNPAIGANAALNSIMKFNGFLRVDAPESISLGVGSDDGSELLIQGTQVINNDFLHSFPGGGPITVDFTAAGLYAIEIVFFESQSSEWGLEFYTGAAAAGTPVSTALLYVVPEPATGSLIACGGAALMAARRRKRHC